MKQISAVEWLVEQLEGDDSKIARVIGLKKYNSIIKEAKEMERKQIMKAWIDGNYNIDSNGNPSENYSISDEKYYKETFKSE